MRLLMTTDAVGGVWQYSLALTGELLAQADCRVMMVCLGEPRLEDVRDVVPSGDLELVALPLKLEWMPDAAGDVARGLEQIAHLVDLWKPDLVHSNQFCFGLLDRRVPRVVVAHSDVLSWRRWHLGESVGLQDHSEMDLHLSGYRDLVASGLAAASAVVCPSSFMADSLREIYGHASLVIHNGLRPGLYPLREKRPVAVVAGRLWDEAKGVAAAVEAVEGLPMELELLGPTVGPSGEATLLPSGSNVRYLGNRSWRETRKTLAEASFYLATSSYEPFGLAALEAAFCGCALLAADTPAYREVWGPAGLYFRRNGIVERRHSEGPSQVGRVVSTRPSSGSDLAGWGQSRLLDRSAKVPGLHQQLERLLQDPAEAGRMGDAARSRALERYTADRMAAQYLDLYRSLTE